MEDDIDIYEDLPSFEIKCNENVVLNDQNSTTHEHIELEKQISELTIKLQDCQKVNKTLETNLFSLLRTAKAEIARKDKMIQDLRKRLDDVTFKRGIHVQPNEYIVHKSTFCETIPNTHYKSINFASSSIKHSVKTTEVDSLPRNLTKDQQKKSTLTPITVFGERLRKRIADEQSLEKKDNQLSKFNVSGSTTEFVEGYVAESDKENGSLTCTNSCNSKEIQSSAVEPYSGSECSKSPMITSGIIAKDYLPNDRNERDAKFQRKSTCTVKCIGKRTNEETNRPTSGKRIKTMDEDYSPRLINKEVNSCVGTASIQEHDFIKCSEFKSHDNLSETLRDTLKSLNIERAMESSVDTKKNGYLISDSVKKHRNDRKDMKNESNISSNKKVSFNENSSKRYNHLDQNSKFTLNERNTVHRSIEIFNRDDHRTNVDGHRRSKQREDRRVPNIDIYRSRERLNSLYVKDREDRYNRNKYNNNNNNNNNSSSSSSSNNNNHNNNNKHGNYGERSEKRYDFRRNGDKLKLNNHLVEKESIDELRTTTDRTKRSTTDHKINNIQTSDRHEYESRRLKRDNSASKREKKQHEYKYSRKKSANEKPTERSKYSEVIKSEKRIEKNDCPENFGRNDQIETKSSTKFHNELRNCADESHVSQLEDGKILSTSTKSSSKGNSEHKDTKDHLKTEIDLSPSVEVMKRNTKRNEKINGTESAAELEIFPDHISRCLTTVARNTGIAYSKKEHSDITRNTENMENVENIEKFIRDYVSNDKSNEEILPDSKNLLTDVRVIHDNDSKCEKHSEFCVVDPKDNQVILPDRKENINEKFKMILLSNTSPSVINDFVENQRMEMQPTTVAPIDNFGNLMNKIARLPQNSVTETLDNTCTIDHIVKKVSDRVQAEIPPGKSNNEGSKDVEGYNDLENQNGNSKTEGNHQCNSRNNGGNYNRNNQNNRETNRKNAENGYVSITTKMVREKNMIVKRDDAEGDRTSESSMNVHGKVVLFTRRTKPVCLTNNNANMTVLVSNNCEVSADSSGTRNKTMRSPLSKLRTCRRSRQDPGESIGC